jgi:hypothetical protein
MLDPGVESVFAGQVSDISSTLTVTSVPEPDIQSALLFAGLAWAGVRVLRKKQAA